MLLSLYCQCWCCRCLWCDGEGVKGVCGGGDHDMKCEYGGGEGGVLFFCSYQSCLSRSGRLLVFLTLPGSRCNGPKCAVIGLGGRILSGGNYARWEKDVVLALKQGQACDLLMCSHAVRVAHADFRS